MNEYLTVALSKGRLAELSIELFNQAGVNTDVLKEKTRKLILFDEKNKIKFFLAKPADVPTYVEYGAADMGIVGKDTLLEEGRDLYEVLNLGFAKCKMCLAGPKEYEDSIDELTNKRIGTKYPNIAREYFERKRKESVEIIKLNGSVELAPLVGLSEMIVDLVETGRTLKENGLVVLDEIHDISARLIINKVSMKMKSKKITEIIQNMKNVLETGGENID